MMILEITDDDVKKGRKADAHYCPAARAFARKLEVPMSHVLMGCWQAVLDTKVYVLSTPLTRAIQEYDDCAAFVPGRYHLKLL